MNAQTITASIIFALSPHTPLSAGPALGDGGAVGGGGQTIYATISALADTTASEPVWKAPLESPKSDSPNRFSLSYRMALNVTVAFRNVGTFTSPGHAVPGQGTQAGNPGPDGGHGYNRTYDDGYNWIDSSGNAGGQTWYFGYDNATAQVRPSADNPQSVILHSSSSAGASARNRDDDPLPGCELTYNRELFRKLRARGAPGWLCGLEGAFGYNNLSISDGRPLTADVTRITDTFSVPASFSGQPFTQPQHVGFYGQPGPVISDNPSRTRSVIKDGESISGVRQFDADLFGFRVGPYLEIALCERAAFSLSGGFAVIYARSDFRFQETATIAGIGSASSAASGAHEDWLPGGFVAGNFSYAFAEDWGVFAGAQFEDVGKYSHREGGKQAVLDLTEAIFVTIGLSHSF